jgi:predicted DNA-binding transcriptional regulator AlpA
MTPTITEPEYLSQSGLAQMLQLSVRTVQRITKRPDFPRPIRFGRCYRWFRAEVEEFLQKEREEVRD